MQKCTEVYFRSYLRYRYLTINRDIKQKNIIIDKQISINIMIGNIDIFAKELCKLPNEMGWVEFKEPTMVGLILTPLQIALLYMRETMNIRFGHY